MVYPHRARQFHSLASKIRVEDVLCGVCARSALHGEQTRGGIAAPGWVAGGFCMNKQTEIHLSDCMLVACEICLKEIPVSEASSCEASDYVVHFCGLDCYEKWRKQDVNDDPESI